MGLFGKASKKASEPDRRRFHNRALVYVSERASGGGETVLGRAGHMNLAPEGKISVYCGAELVFRGSLDSVELGELMSLEGAVLRGYDETVARERTVVAYYKYYRKL